MSAVKAMYLRRWNLRRWRSVGAGSGGGSVTVEVNTAAVAAGWVVM